MKRPLAVTSIVPVAALALLAAGCGSGGGSPQGIATLGTTTTSTTTSSSAQGGLVAFSHCMRSRGISNFPDPQRYAGGNVKLTIHQYGTTPTPQFQTALNACSPLIPGGRTSQQTAQQQRKQLADALSFARCMRSHGVGRFPDPTGQGQLSVAMVEAQGIDVHSPQFLRVVQTCLPASHGGLTAAKVRAAIASH